MFAAGTMNGKPPFRLRVRRPARTTCRGSPAVGPEKSTRLDTKRSSSSGLGPAPLGAVALLGCCAARAVLVGGVAATSIALFGIPAILLGAALAGLWWGMHRQ